MTQDELFSEWRSRSHHNKKAFITDGAINPDRWCTDNTKMLFLAKEAYGEKGSTESWDLPTLVREEWKGPKHKFWWTLGYWAIAIRNTTIDSLANFPLYTIKDGNYEPVIQAVLSAAIVNIKKSDGLSSSNNDNLQSYVDLDGDLIKRQIQLLAPKIILCCNTWQFVHKLWPEAKEISQFAFYLEETNQLILEYSHPANQYPNAVMFYALTAIYQNALKAISNSLA